MEPNEDWFILHSESEKVNNILQYITCSRVSVQIPLGFLFPFFCRSTYILEMMTLHSFLLSFTQKNKIKPVRIVDVPGHPRLRPKLDEFLLQAAGIVFVVDALDFLPNCRAVAE